MKEIAKAIVIVGLAATGMAGIYLKVDGAGWLFVPVVMVLLAMSA